MPYKDPEKQKKFQREWQAKRRKEWFDANGPCVDCGSWERLELDHDDPKTKKSHAIWSWTEERRLAELAKCKVRCHDCHNVQSLLSKVKDIPPHGTVARYNHGFKPCRCQDCRDAHAAKMKAYRHRVGENTTFRDS